jgi:hypothetical protein
MAKMKERYASVADFVLIEKMKFPQTTDGEGKLAAVKTQEV